MRELIKSAGHVVHRATAALAILGGLTDKKALADKAKLREVAHIIEASGFMGVEVGEDVEHGTGIISFRSRRDGVDRDVRIDWNLLTSAEYRQLAGNAYGIEAIAAKHFAVRKVEESGSKKEAAALADATEHETLDEAMAKLYTGAEKGLSIQRYKGLGEMNAEQLWETTMDPQRRRLLQVRVEDDIEADGIFTILMGDQVEPRRQFIEDNALSVANLDV
jgi:DNA gyrase subunit B